MKNPGISCIYVPYIYIFMCVCDSFILNFASFLMDIKLSNILTLAISTLSKRNRICIIFSFFKKCLHIFFILKKGMHVSFTQKRK
jgi:hypothetical protein